MIGNFLSGLALFLEREAGHDLMSIALIGFGLLLLDPQARAAAAHDLVVFGLGVLARSMGQRTKEGQ